MGTGGSRKLRRTRRRMRSAAAPAIASPTAPSTASEGDWLAETGGAALTAVGLGRIAVGVTDGSGVETGLGTWGTSVGTEGTDVSGATGWTV